MVDQFKISGMPELIFGRHVSDDLWESILEFGQNVLIIGDAYLDAHPHHLENIEKQLSGEDIEFTYVSALGKQTEEVAQDILHNYFSTDYDCVVSIGGARAIDAAKLVAQDCDHIAVPTTAGTGAAMNDVIFGGDSAYQEQSNASLLPTLVIADPELIDDMERSDFAARSLSVLMLLLEAYVSPRASVLSDAMVWSGLEAFARGFVKGVEGDQEGRGEVFYASLMAGVGTGQAGFGLTHQMGAMIEQNTDLTYAQSCATICAESVDAQIQMLTENLPDNEALDKYAMVGELLAQRPFEDREEAYASMIGTLRRWVTRLELPKLPMKSDVLETMCEESQQDDAQPAYLPTHMLFDALSRRLA